MDFDCAERLHRRCAHEYATARALSNRQCARRGRPEPDHAAYCRRARQPGSWAAAPAASRRAAYPASPIVPSPWHLHVPQFGIRRDYRSTGKQSLLTQRYSRPGGIILAQNSATESGQPRSGLSRAASGSAIVYSPTYGVSAVPSVHAAIASVPAVHALSAAVPAVQSRVAVGPALQSCVAV